MSSIDSANSIQGPRAWRLQFAGQGEPPLVHEGRAREAAQIDANQDGVCSDSEIEAFLRTRRDIRAQAQGNIPRIVSEFKAHLEGPDKAPKAGYRSLETIEQEMRDLAEAHPDRVQLQSIAKTAEGRDVWAMKVTSDAQTDTSNKPGVVITGTHHAREWMTPEVTLQLAEDLVNGYDTAPDAKRRLDSAELWIIPVVNPDGFQYSRTQDSWWRKNRTPVTGDGTECPKDKPGEVRAYGVDLNRNYWDGKPEHMKYFRADGDTPCSTMDDRGASDSPSSDTFRGVPGKEPEVAALMALEYGRPNIRGILDHHSYGNTLLRPWGHTREVPANVADYDEAAGRMQAAQGKGRAYEYYQSVVDYPTFGSSETAHQGNGIMNFTIEMGTSFQPAYTNFPSIYKDVSAADLAFIDYIAEKHPATSPVAPVPADRQPPTTAQA